VHILIIRLSALGDILRTLPALHELRRAHPGARITWLAQDMARDLLDPHPETDEWLYFPRKEWTDAGVLTRFIKTLRAREYDLALDFHGRFKSAALLVAARARRKAGLAPPVSREGSCFLYREVVKTEEKNRVAQSFALLRHIGIAPQLPPRWTLPVPAEAAAWAEGWAKETLGGRPYAVLFTATSRSRYGTAKEWSEENFAAIGRRLRDENSLPIVLPYGVGEETRARSIAAKIGEGAHVPPPLPLSRLAALIARASLYAGGDTGPTHLSWLLGTPTLAFFLATSPEVNAAPPGVPRYRALSLAGDADDVRAAHQAAAALLQG
jgi:heptosyltransferase I